MEKLLQWSIAQQTGDKEAIAKTGQPDPKMLSQLFGGPDEPTLMKQAIIVVNHPEAADEDRITALENFEMLIENLDNANNIENMKLWPDVINQLSSPNETFQVLGASIIAIATQNNPPSQDAFLKHENGLAKLLELAQEAPKEVQLKSIFALASLVRNHEQGIAKFAAADGWKCLKLDASVGDDKAMVRKLSLLSALLSTGLDAQSTEEIRTNGVVSTLAGTLSADGHAGCIDKSLNIIGQLKASNYAFSDNEKSEISKGLDAIESKKDQISEEDYASAKTAIA